MPLSDQFHNYIKDSKQIFIIPSRPLDLDCVASSLLLKKYLEQLGKKVRAKFPKKIIAAQRGFYQHLPYFNELEDGDTAEDLKNQNFDCLILLDGSTWGQFHQDLELHSVPDPKTLPKVIQIDHHEKQEQPLGDLTIIDKNASSTAEVLFSQIIPVERLTPELATLGYAALIGDTGNFRWHTVPNTLELAANLLKKGADPAETLEKYFFSKSKDELEMIAFAIENIEYEDNLGSVFLSLPFSAIKEEGIDTAKLRALKDSFNHELSFAIKGYPRGFLIYEDEPGVITISARGSVIYNKINLPNLLAKVTESSGGHFNAAGAKLKGDFNSILEALIAALKTTL